MIAQNHKKSKKFKFEEVEKVDFSWDIKPEGLSAAIEPVYRRFLRNVYQYNPSNHEFDRERFSANDSE